MSHTKDLETQLQRLKKLHALRQEELQQVKELVDKMAAQRSTGNTDSTGTGIETASIDNNNEKRKI